MKGHIIEFKNSPTKKALDVTTAERDNLRNEIANLKSQLAQKDATISSLNSQASETNSWKSYYNSAQSQVSNLSSSLSQSQSQLNNLNLLLAQSQSEAQSLKQQITDQTSLKQENHNLLNQVNELKKPKTNLATQITQTDDIAELISESTQTEDNKQENTIVKDLQIKLMQAETKIDVMIRFFDEAKQREADSQKELKSYKKSLVKKHDLSMSQSIEIEKLKQELLEMSQSQVDMSHLSQGGDLSPYIEKLNLSDIHSTESHLITTQKVTEYKQTNKTNNDTIFSELVEYFYPNTTTENTRLAGENFTVIDKDAS